MTPALRLAISLVVSLMLWLPSLPTAVRMEMAPEMIGLRYLLALVVSRIGVGLVFRIVNGYAADGEEIEEPDGNAGDDSAGPVFGRRSDDWVDVDGEDVDQRSDEQLLDDALEDAHDAAVLVP